jgi:hypothetical protein
VYAAIDLEVHRGEHVFRLDIQFQDRNNYDMAPFELDGTPTSIDQGAAGLGQLDRLDLEDKYVDHVPTEQQEPHSGNTPLPAPTR